MKIRVYFRGERSEEEEVPDPGGLDPGDVGGGAGEDAGLVLHCAADGTKTDHAVHLPTIPVELTEQRPPGVPLRRDDGGSSAVVLGSACTRPHGSMPCLRAAAAAEAAPAAAEEEEAVLVWPWFSTESPLDQHHRLFIQRHTYEP